MNNNTANNYTAMSIAVKNDVSNDFMRYYCKDDFVAVIKNWKNDSSWSDKAVLLKDMFKAVGIDCEIKNSPRYYEKFLSELGDDFPETPSDLLPSLLNCMYNVFSYYPSPENIIKRILDNCGSQDFKNEPSLRVRLLKEFLRSNVEKYNGKPAIAKYYKVPKKDTEKLLTVVKDDVFNLLKEATSKEQLKKDGTYGLLAICDELANGNFRINGSSKEILYVLAIILNMKYYPDSSQANTVDDIKKNLFEDYYNDNILRYINSQKDIDSGKYEDEPIGLSINYKNFAEVVYLYYLNQPGTAEEKIEKIDALLNRIKNSSHNMQFEEKDSAYYREYMINKALSLKENELYDFLSENYNCGIIKNDKNEFIGFFVEQPQRTANEQLKIILEQLTEGSTEIKSIDDFMNSDVGNWIKADTINIDFDDSLYTNKDNYASFKKVLERAVTKLNSVSELNVKSSKITRTKIITAFFHLYCDAAGLQGKRKSFSVIFEEVKNWVNDYLENCGYMLFDYKNFFDVLVVFFIYLRTNNIME